MTAYTIDTLAIAWELKKAGFESEQAEAVAQAIAHSGQESVGDKTGHCYNPA